MIPPSTMPSMAPLVQPSEMYPNAVPRTLGGNVSAMIAPLFACISAPPTACMPREAISQYMPGDRPQNNDPSVNIPNPAFEHPAPSIDVTDPAELGGADCDHKQVDQDHPERGDESRMKGF